MTGQSAELRNRQSALGLITLPTIRQQEGQLARPQPQQMMEAFGLTEPPDVIKVPNPKRPREEQQDQRYRDIEIDPTLYMPEDVRRDLITEWTPLEIDPKRFLGGPTK